MNSYCFSVCVLSIQLCFSVSPHIPTSTYEVKQVDVRGKQVRRRLVKPLNNVIYACSVLVDYAEKADAQYISFFAS